MTDDSSHPQNGSKPRFKVADGQLWQRNDRDEWFELEVLSPASDDPEIIELWGMPVTEVERIAHDEAHPLQQKAQQVQSEAMRPVAEAMSVTWQHMLGIAPPGKHMVWDFFSPAAMVQEAEVEEPSMSQMHAIWQAMLEEMRRANEYWRQSIENAQQSGQRANQIAKESNDISRASKTIAAWALIVSIIATAAAVVSLFV